MTVIRASIIEVFPAPVSPVSAVVPAKSNVRSGRVPQLMRMTLLSFIALSSVLRLSRVLLSLQGHRLANKVRDRRPNRDARFTILRIDVHRNSNHSPHI